MPLYLQNAPSQTAGNASFYSFNHTCRTGLKLTHEVPPAGHKDLGGSGRQSSGVPCPVTPFFLPFLIFIVAIIIITGCLAAVVQALILIDRPPDISFCICTERVVLIHFSVHVHVSLCLTPPGRVGTPSTGDARSACTSLHRISPILPCAHSVHKEAHGQQLRTRHTWNE